MLIKLIVRVRHALMTYPQQSYDVSVHVYTYTKCSNDIDVCAQTETWLKARLDQKKIFYPMKIVNTWNNLPASVAEAPTIGSFKRRLKKHRRSLVIS